MDDKDRSLAYIENSIDALTKSIDDLRESQVKNSDRLLSIEISLSERKGAEKILVWLAGATGVAGIMLATFGKAIAKALNPYRRILYVRDVAQTRVCSPAYDG